MSKKNPALYSEASIKVLKGLEPVKQRPGMYTRTEHPLHIVQEIIDNASDEALAGYARQISVTLHADGAVTVDDDGRGIPFGLHPEEGRPVIEIVFTRLHAGGKFNKRDGVANSAYTFSGGLHGVGVSVTNALSKRLDVTVWRDGKMAEIGFADGEVVRPLTLRAIAKEGGTGVSHSRASGVTPPCRTGVLSASACLASTAVRNSWGRGEKQRGTRVTAWPDPKYFDAPHLPLVELQRLLRAKAVLLAGVALTLLVEKTGERYCWRYAQGLRDYLLEGLAGSEPLIPLFEGERFAGGGEPFVEAAGSDDQFAAGEGAAWVVAWTDTGPLLRESYVNLIPTPAGGTHEAGLREGLFQAVKSFIALHNLLPKGVKLLPDDVFSRASFVLSAKVLDPQFQGQIKERLNSREAVRLVSAVTRPALELWLNQHVGYGRQLADFVIRQAQARARAAQKIEKRKSSGVAVLPGKLTDCEATELARNELFLVEGDSAGGSAKMGRDKTFQAILPLRGKVLNTWETERNRLFANHEVHDIAVAIGVDPHGPHEAADLSNLRYGKICILSDADVDGAHIQVLLLTLFFRHFPQLIARGHLYIAQPPLFRVDVPQRSTRSGAKRPAQKRYALDDGELQAILDKLRQDGGHETQWTISRFKGLGEMSAEQLWDTTMNPDTRRLMPVALGDFGFDTTVNIINMLMGKGEAAARRSWLEEHGNQVEADI